MEILVYIDDDIEPTWIQIPKELQIEYSGDPVKAIMDEIYGSLQLTHGNIDYLRDRAILTPLNEYVAKINEEALDRLPGDVTVYQSCDSICKALLMSAADEVLYPPEYLNSLKFSGLPNHEFRVRGGPHHAAPQPKSKERVM